MPTRPLARLALLLTLSASAFTLSGAAPLAGQARTGTVVGVVLDAEGVPVVAADVRVEREETVVRSATTDEDGRYRVTRLAPGPYRIRAARIGYAPETVNVAVTEGATALANFFLERSAVVLPGVAVEASRSRERIRFEREAALTIRALDRDELKRIPGAFEADPVRAIEVLPGVVSTTDFSSAFHVRGGSADQNLILLDGFPVFSPFHLGGFFSVFNADMVERAELSSGGFPAEFGGRVSSVLEITSDPGGGELAVDGGLSLLASRVAVAGGFGSDGHGALGLRDARWRVSARRSYFDVVLRPFFDFPYHLRDLQGVFDAFTPGGDRITVTAYSGRDVLELTEGSAGDFPLLVDWDWGNDLVGARWMRTWDGGGGISVSAGHSRFGSGLLFPDFGDTDLRTSVDQTLFGVDIELPTLGGWRVETGIDLDRFTYDNLARSGGTVFGQADGSAWLTALYAQGAWRGGESWLVEVGARLDGWRPAPGERVWAASPRLGLKRFVADGRWAVKGSIGRYTQFLQSLRDEELPLGLDTWVLAGERAPHVVSDQLQLGLEGFFGAREAWQLALEAYVRDFDGVVTLNGADNPNDPLDDILAGEGVSYGADLLLKRTEGAVRGWLALSWLKAERTFVDALSPFDPPPEVTFAPVFDRRLDVDLVLRFPFYDGWEAGVRWNVGTGTPYTRPVTSFASFRTDLARPDGRFIWTGGPGETGLSDGLAVSLGDRNAQRYPVYHRLDASFRTEIETSWGTVVPHVDILNLYNRRNVLFYFFEYDRTPPTRSGISMFPFLPAAGVEVRF